jgi:8-oxo-dGTP pyrophosphatase MutT (NUDIX family)
MDELRAQLASLLETFIPADEREATHHENMFALIDSPDDPFSRTHFHPGHFTASAFVLSPDGGSLLLILHAKLHRWLQPGGHIDADDPTVLHAALRELAEETGLFILAETHEQPIFDVDIHPIPANPDKNEPAHKHYDVRFLFRATTTHLIARSDAKDARWVPLDEITPQMADDSVMRALAKIRRGV